MQMAEKKTAQGRADEDRVAEDRTEAARRVPRAGKDATQLMKAGTWFLSTGAVAILLIFSIFGGFGDHGPHTNTGWALLVLALMSFPLGLLLLALGGAKWLGRRP